MLRKSTVLSLVVFLVISGAAIISMHHYIEKRKVNAPETLSNENIPKSVAIIMDGNGRWAKNRNLGINEGHRKGAETLEKILEHAEKIGIESLTIYTFSTENWERSKEEVGYILSLVDSYLDRYQDKFEEKNIRFKVIGDIDKLDQNTIAKIRELEKKTAENNSLFLNVAFSYGGRAEIVDAAKNIARDVKSNRLSIDDINEDMFKKYLYNPDIIYPDFVIRTGAQLRISNFLLWEISYSELYFTNVLWPDFDEKCLDAAIEEFKNRKRTYGKRKI
ncbi:MAG: di-trans,poly-cis-decaprenylcistransferase [Rickettsiales bacterium]|jgi:undecaprenyl diphosphate synthase|nr:di-trans,poly-cis-decaprenylcistransferase [Rickettsiales bacterium]